MGRRDKRIVAIALTTAVVLFAGSVTGLTLGSLPLLGATGALCVAAFFTARQMRTKVRYLAAGSVFAGGVAAAVLVALSAPDGLEGIGHVLVSGLIGLVVVLPAGVALVVLFVMDMRRAGEASQVTVEGPPDEVA